MKSVSVLAFAAGAAATFGFHDAPPFSCPGNTDNKCTEKQLPGFDWKDATPGPFDRYDDFDFRGWECRSGNGRRDRFDARTFSGKSIFGSCGSDKKSSPSFGCGSRGQTDKFSLGGIHVVPEFDCDLEFHYDMPDGSQCKHRSPCSSKGTWVKNNQCGGAKNVTIVYPPQPQKPKKTCGVHVPSITFDCSTKPTPTKPATKPPTTKPTKPATTPAVPTSPVDTETCTDDESTPATKPTKPVTTPSSPAETTPTQSKPSETTPTDTKPVETKPTETKPAETTPAESTPAESTPAESTPGQTTTSNSPIQSTESSYTVTTTSFLSTSTIFTTTVSTITSCAETVTDCPAGSVTTTIVTVPVSTTVCPVTETSTVPVTKPTETKPGQETTSNSPISSSSKPEESVPATVTKPNKPEETLPCPGVVPQCLNTFLFQLSCSDNTDHACYCPDKLFVESIFSCIYAHGESDTIISQAVVFFQGLCAPYVPENPAIATGATVTTYITVTATPPPAQQTTVTVDKTTVVPCTDDNGSEIPNSSTTLTISTTMTVPQVGFTTTEGTVAIVPAPTTPAGPKETGKVSPPGATTTKNSPVGGGAAGPTGTGALTPTPTGGFATVNAGGRTSAGFGLAGFAVMAVAALL